MLDSSIRNVAKAPTIFRRAYSKFNLIKWFGSKTKLFSSQCDMREEDTHTHTYEKEKNYSPEITAVAARGMFLPFVCTFYCFYGLGFVFFFVFFCCCIHLSGFSFSIRKWHVPCNDNICPSRNCWLVHIKSETISLQILCDVHNESLIFIYSFAMVYFRKGLLYCVCAFATFCD